MSEAVKIAAPPPSDERLWGLRLSRLNQRRLANLCRYLAENRDRFDTPGFTEAAPRWLERPSGKNPMLRVGAVLAVGRMLQNKINDTFWKY